MAQHDSEVKHDHRVRRWMDEGPMVGWKWIALWGALNLLVNLLDLFG